MPDWPGTPVDQPKQDWPGTPTGGTTAAPKPQEALDTESPMPGIGGAVWHGAQQGLQDIKQSVQVAQGQQPTQTPAEEQPEAKPFEWRDLYEPTRGLNKLAYQLGASGPTVGGGVAGGLAGSAVGPAGAVGGGALGAAAGSALQTIGPAFARHLKATPNDPDTAWDRAVKETLATGAFSGASWGAFGAKVFSGPIKNLAFQALGVQPALSMGEQATKNVIDDQPIQQGLGQSYAQGAVGTIVPAVGHMILRGNPKAVSEEPTPQQIQDEVAKHRQDATDLRTQAAQPGVSPGKASSLNAKADDMDTIANFKENRNANQQQAVQAEQDAEQIRQQRDAAQHIILKDVLNQQYKAKQQEAREAGFAGSIPTPLSKPTGFLGRLKESYLNNVDPSMWSGAALRADSVIARYRSMKARLEDAIIRRGEETYAYKWPKVDEADQDHFLYAVETGTSIKPDVLQRHPWLDDAARDYRRQLDLTYKLEKEMGSRAHWLENYFPHIWKDPELAAKTFSPENIISTMGSTWFQKARTYDLIELGKSNGLELKHNNIQDAVNSRLIAGEDMINKMEMLHELQRLGVATPAEKAPPHVINPKLTGGAYHWQEVSTPIGEKWLVAPDAQALWENAVKATPGREGLWANQRAAGSAFRGWMTVKNAWVPLKLALSLFHPVHVLHIDTVNHMNRALRETFGRGQQSIGERASALPRALGNIARDWANFPEEIFHQISGNFFRKWQPPSFSHAGREMREAWLTPRENWTPRQKELNQLMNEAGISAQMSEQLRIKGRRAFSDALANNQYLKALGVAPLRGIEKMQHSIFEEWIPNLKVAALQQEAASLFRRRPDLLTDTTNRRVALRALGKQIDNRFGEMFYGGLFWNRTLKDASIGSFLSLGWNLGFVREFGGGAFQPIAQRLLDAPNPSRALVRDVTTKTGNMFLYGLTAGVINGIMTAAFTGSTPEGMDYIFPRIGGLNPDGSPRRVTNAFYTREVPMAMKHIEEQQSVPFGLAEMMYNKMLFQPVVEMVKNRDYFGNKIYDEGSPAYQRIYQIGKHMVGDQLNPISIAGARRALQLSGKPYGPWDIIKQAGQMDEDVMMPLMGFGPAPGYASRSSIENRIQYLAGEHVYPKSKSFETGEQSQAKIDARTDYMQAKQRGDQAMMQKAAEKLRELGIKTSKIQKMIPGQGIDTSFKRLDVNDKRSLLRDMNRDEFKHYIRLVSKEMRADPTIRALIQKWGAQGPL